MAFDLDKLIEMAPFLMGALRGPSPEGSAMIEGYVKGQHQKKTYADQDMERKRQALLDALTQQQQQFSQQNTLADNARADERLGLDRENMGLARQSATLGKLKTLQEMGTARAGQLADAPTSDASTPDTQNKLAEDLFQMTQQGNLAPGAARGMLPNMAGLIAERDKKHYREQLDKVAKDPIYAGLIGTPEFENMTVKDRKGGLIKIGDIRQQLGDQVMDASGAPVTPKVKPSASEDSAVYKEWKNYKTEGGTLSFDAYMTADANRKKPTVNVNTGGVGAGALDEGGLDFAATQYRVTGVMPALGMGNGPARAAILNRAASQAKTLNQTPVASIQKQAAFKSDGAALTKMTSMSAAAEAYESKALQQADLVDGLSAKVGRSQWPIVNDALLTGKTRIAGDENASVLVNALTTFTSE